MAKAKAKPVKPTADEVKKEIEILRDYAGRVRPESHFGDNNVASIEAQITVMREDLDEDEIYEKYESEEEDGPRSELDNALEARRWMDGEGEDGAPSEGWKPLLQK